MTPDRLFTQAGRVFEFTYGEKKIACNYYFSRKNLNSPNEKLWMNILFQLGEKKELFEITAEQRETALLLKPKKAQDEKVQKFIEAYLTHML